MRIGIFGGSFDPVHIEHVNVAKATIRSLALDKLLIMPAYAPPHKKGKILSPDSDRLAMCQKAFADILKAEVCDYEIKSGGVSYTYLTCRHFKEEYADAELFWLVGTDMLRDFPTWKEPLDILKNATLAVCARAEEDGWVEKERAAFYEKFHTDFAIVEYNGADISSTKIRVLAGAGQSVLAYTGEAVASYIKEKGLYLVPRANEALALEKPERAAHSLRVAEVAAKRAHALGVPEYKAIAASLFHDCGKNLSLNHSLLKNFKLQTEWGEVPEPVVHQFTGAYLAERVFGVTDEEVIDAVRFHSSAKPNMSALGKLVFLADLVEESRTFPAVYALRELFWENKKGEGGLDECLEKALEDTLKHLEKQGAFYPLTIKAYEYLKNDRR